MTKLDDLRPNAVVCGVLTDRAVTVVGAQGFGSNAIELTYKDLEGKVDIDFREQLRACCSQGGRMNVVAFFNNKGGVGKTTLLYHVTHMLAELNEQVLVADLDPQANATTMLLQEDRLEELWPEGEHPQTIYGAMRPIIRGVGDSPTCM